MFTTNSISKIERKGKSSYYFIIIYVLKFLQLACKNLLYLASIVITT